MMTVMRTIIELPGRQVDALSRLCREQGISRAEAIRRAVDRLLEESKPTHPDAGFGAWRDKKSGSRSLVERLRAEWRR
jgi:metal-responsive CopG/Arc/MetJ family transcriptional regulator